MWRKGAKYISGRGPLELVYYEVFEDKKDAMKREYAIKQLKKSEKEKLINYKSDKNLTNFEKNIIDNWK